MWVVFFNGELGTVLNYYIGIAMKVNWQVNLGEGFGCKTK